MSTQLTRAIAIAYAIALPERDFEGIDQQLAIEANKILDSFCNIPMDRVDIRRYYIATLAAKCLLYLADTEEDDPEITKYAGWRDAAGISCPYCDGAGGFLNTSMDESGDVIYDGDACTVCDGRGGISIQPLIIDNPFRGQEGDASREKAMDCNDPFAM